MVHGFQGSSFDMKYLKNLLQIKYQDAHFLCSNSNEENTECDILAMGKNLAKEIKTFVIQTCPGSKPDR
jgi:hypothetical protein